MKKELNPEFIKKLKKIQKESKEGRTYLFYCTCDSKANKKTICFECHAKDCKKWYNLGRKDERKKLGMFASDKKLKEYKESRDRIKFRSE
jgi:hypothetical protein